jgi:hypothetical protein
MAQKGRRTTRNWPSKGARNSNNAIRGRDSGKINQSKGRIRKHLDGRTNPDRGSNAHQSRGRDLGNVILKHMPTTRSVESRKREENGSFGKENMSSAKGVIFRELAP